MLSRSGYENVFRDNPFNDENPAEIGSFSDGMINIAGTSTNKINFQSRQLIENVCQFCLILNLSPPSIVKNRFGSAPNLRQKNITLSFKLSKIP
jgi:hypothetical protein